MRAIFSRSYIKFVVDYENIRVYKPFSQKNKMGIYKKAKSISLVVLILLICLSIFSAIYKEKVFTLEKKAYFGVCIGSYASQQTADYYATVAKARGGCGGVYKTDEQYLVFVAVYIKESDAKTIATNLAETEDSNISVYVFELPKVKIKLTEGNRAVLNDALSLFDEHTEKLLSMSIDFDNNILNGSDVIIEVAQMISEVDSAVKTLKNIKRSDDTAVKILINAFSAQKVALKQISSNVIHSADIKITYFDLLIINLNTREKFE